MTHPHPNHLSSGRSRCHDKGCPDRDECLRWTDRDCSWAVSHVASMRPDGWEGACPYLLREDLRW